ncbi:YfbM family protein [Gordonia sp. CPCC 205333]|uniref:YfbM family protein n=1 Tax=Gordonia sp. CPCC 205333 TaxID=3140790 RepID=UPI003AF39AAA
MGQIAQYQRLEGAQLDELLAGNRADVFERIEELAEEGGGVEDIDKLWDGLHFVLTGKPGSEPIDGDAVSEAIVGIAFFDDDEDADFITYIPADQVGRIRVALDAVPDEKVAHGFDAKTMRTKVYPNIWSGDPAELIATLITELHRLQEFYRVAHDTGQAVVVSIY